MKFAALIFLASYPALLLGQSSNQATLTLIEEAGFNEVEIELDVEIIGASNDTSTLTGTLEVEVNISPVEASTDELTIISADVSGTDISLEAGNIIASYDFVGTDFGFNAETITPPGTVDPITGEFEADQHQVTATEGLLSGEARSIATGTTDVDFDFNEESFSGAGVGTGTITVTPGRIEGRRLYFDLTVELPLSLTQIIDQEDLPIAAEVEVAGTIKAIGETFLEYPDYQTWATDLGLAPDSEDESDLSIATPNFLLFALGFDQATAPREIFEFGQEGITLKVGGELGLGSVEIEWSDDLVTWDRVPQASMVSGNSAINFGDSLLEAPTVMMTDAKKYLRLVRSTAR